MTQFTGARRWSWSRLMLRFWRLLTMMLAALAMGLMFCHVLERPAKLRQPVAFYSAVNSTLYAAFAPAGAFLMLGQIVAAGLLAYLVRRRRPVFAFTLSAVVGFVLALLAWAVLVYPVNAAARRAWDSAPSTLPEQSGMNPPDAVVDLWKQRQARWENGHAITFGIQFIAVLLLTWSILLETPAAYREGQTAASSSGLRIGRRPG